MTSFRRVIVSWLSVIVSLRFNSVLLKYIADPFKILITVIGIGFFLIPYWYRSQRLQRLTKYNALTNMSDFTLPLDIALLDITSQRIDTKGAVVKQKE